MKTNHYMIIIGILMIIASWAEGLYISASLMEWLGRVIFISIMWLSAILFIRSGRSK